MAADPKDDALSQIQDEVRAVRSALQSGGSFLGMTGEPLQRYLILLTEKENILLSQRAQQLSEVAAAQGLTSSTVFGSAMWSCKDVGALEGLWVHKENPELEEIIANGAVRGRDGTIAPIQHLEGCDKLEIELHGMRHHAERIGDELVWDDGDVWVMVQALRGPLDGSWRQEGQEGVQVIRGNTLQRPDGTFERIEEGPPNTFKRLSAIGEAYTTAKLVDGELQWDTGEVWRPLSEDSGAAEQCAPSPQAALDASSLESVLVHLTQNEASPSQCSRALRVLASLSYQRPKEVAAGGEVVQQLLRLLVIHAEEPLVQQRGIQVLNNLAYDKEVTQEHLLEPRVLSALLAAMARGATNALRDQVIEAIARIITWELQNPGAVTAGASGAGVLVNIFYAAVAGPSAWRAAAFELVSRLIERRVDERPVVEMEVAFSQFVATAQKVISSPLAVAGWLEMAKLLAGRGRQALLVFGGLAAILELMSHQISDRHAQLNGLLALSALVGSSEVVADDLLAAKGLRRIEEALSEHMQDAEVQLVCIHLLGGLVKLLQHRKPRSASIEELVTVTVLAAKAAMREHEGDPVLISSAFDVLRVLLPAELTQVASAGGYDLIRCAIDTHPSSAEVQRQGKEILAKFGAPL